MRFGKPTKNKHRQDPRYFLTEKLRVDNNSNRNMHDVQFYLEELYPFCKEALGFDKDASIVFETDLSNAKNPLGKTAYYSPDSHTVSVYVDNRHPKDVLRSIAHELVHHHQNVRGDLQGASMEEGYAQEDEHLREMEREAYETGNMLFRDWEDGRKNNNTTISEKEDHNYEEGQLVTVIASALAVDGEKTGTVVTADDKSVTIELDDDQEGKYVPEDKMVRIKKDYVEPRVEAGTAEFMGEEEVNEMYDDFDMDELEDEFPFLRQGVKSKKMPKDVAVDLDAEFGSDEKPEEEEDLTVMKEDDGFQVGDTVDILGSVLSGANGKIVDFVTTTTGVKGAVIELSASPKRKGHQIYGQPGDEVVVRMKFLSPAAAVDEAKNEAFRGSDKEKEMMDKMSDREHYDYVTKGRDSRAISDDEANAIKSFNDWLNDKSAKDHWIRQAEWEPAQSYRGGRVLAYKKAEYDPQFYNLTGKFKEVGEYYDVTTDLPVSGEELQDILPEATKGDQEMNLEEIIRQAVRKVIKEGKYYRREDDGEKEEKAPMQEDAADDTFEMVDAILAVMDPKEAFANLVQAMERSAAQKLLGFIIQQYEIPMGMDEAESTEKYDDDPKLKGDQDELPDHLQKAIIDDEETNEVAVKSMPDDEYGGEVHVLPGVEFTGDIDTDIAMLTTDPEMDSWLHGEMGSGDSITDSAGKVAYAGADVQDVLKALDKMDAEFGGMDADMDDMMFESNDNWYNSNLFESLKKKWTK